MRQELDVRFSASFPRLHGVAYRVAFRILGVRAEAEDVAAEVLTRAYARWSRLADEPEPWIVRVAANLALDTIRKRKTRDRHDPGSAALGPPADSGRRVDLQRALLKLPRRQREVVVLRYLADISEAGVAKELGISPGSVKSHSARALAALRSTLQIPKEDHDV